jgi:hypothetical protein
MFRILPRLGNYLLFEQKNNYIFENAVKFPSFPLHAPHPDCNNLWVKAVGASQMEQSNSFA